MSQTSNQCYTAGTRRNRNHEHTIRRSNWKQYERNKKHGIEELGFDRTLTCVRTEESVRERERESVCVCVCEREREMMCVLCVLCGREEIEG